eukprot:Rhum_TRINITY_DN256_c0_g1::Rhum_TRINITY_DN256_c0_g1_i1::g.1033::m.1033
MRQCAVGLVATLLLSSSTPACGFECADSCNSDTYDATGHASCAPCAGQACCSNCCSGTPNPSDGAQLSCTSSKCFSGRFAADECTASCLPTHHQMSPLEVRVCSMPGQPLKVFGCELNLCSLPDGYTGCAVSSVEDCGGVVSCSEGYHTNGGSIVLRCNGHLDLFDAVGCVRVKKLDCRIQCDAAAGYEEVPCQPSAGCELVEKCCEMKGAAAAAAKSFPCRLPAEYSGSCKESYGTVAACQPLVLGCQTPQYFGTPSLGTCDSYGGTFSSSGCDVACSLPPGYKGCQPGTQNSLASCLPLAACDVAGGYVQMNPTVKLLECSTPGGQFTALGCYLKEVLPCVAACLLNYQTSPTACMTSPSLVNCDLKPVNYPCRLPKGYTSSFCSSGLVGRSVDCNRGIACDAGYHLAPGAITLSLGNCPVYSGEFDIALGSCTQNQCQLPAGYTGCPSGSTVAACLSTVKCDTATHVPDPSGMGTIGLTCLTNNGQFSAIGCTPQVGCKALTASDVPPGIAIPDDCAAASARCAFGASPAECTEALAMCKVGCTDGHACRSQAGLEESCTWAANGLLVNVPATASQRSMVYYCLCGADCWDSTRAFTPFSPTIGDSCPTETITLTETETLPTPTESASASVTDSKSLTLGTATPSSVDPTDAVQSTLTCVAHFGTAFHTGLPLVCTFVPRDAEGNPVTVTPNTPVTPVVAIEALSTGGGGVATSLSIAGGVASFQATLPAVSAEGLYVVRATYSSPEWAGFAVSVDVALPFELGYPDRVVVECPFSTAPVAATPNPTKTVTLTRTENPTMPVGTTLYCSAVPYKAGCENCRLLLPLKLSLESLQDWGRVADEPTVADTGTAAKNPASARPIVYAVTVANLVLDKLRTLKMNTDVLSAEEVAAKLASNTITARVVDWSGVAVKMLTPVVEETAAEGLFFEHTVDYAFGVVDSLSVECPPTEAGKTTSVEDPIFSWDTGVPGLLPDVRYCYIRSLDSLGNVVVPSLASDDTFNMVLLAASLKTLPPPTKVERGLPNTFDWHTATLTNQVFDDETFYLQSIENVLRPWPVAPTGPLPPYTADRTPLTRIGIASENWGQDSVTFHYKSKAAPLSRPLLSYSRADAASVMECELDSGSVRDPYLEDLYSNTKKVGETPKFLLLPGVLLRCTITMSLDGKVVPALMDDVRVRVETGDAKFVTLSSALRKAVGNPVQKVGFQNPIPRNPVTSDLVGNVFEFEIGMKATAFDGEAEVSAKATELVVEYTPRKLQALAAAARANRVNYDKNGPYSSNPNAANANPFDPLPLLTLAQLDSVDAVAAATSLRKPVVLGSYLLPVAKVFNEQTEITSTFVASSPKFTLSAVIGGSGTQSTAFKAAAKTYSWSCVDPGTAAPIKAGTGKTLELDAVPGGLICSLTITWQGAAPPTGGVPTFLPLTGTASTTVTITTNTFDAAGTVAARLHDTTDPLGGTVTVSNALTQQVFVQCTGAWSDSNGGITYELRQDDGGGSRVLPAQQSTPASKRFVLSLPLSSVDVELKVTCLARDALGAVGTSTNVVVLRVLALVVPSTAASQNAAVKKIYDDSLVIEKTNQQLVNDLAFLALLTKAEASSVLIASTSLFREIVEAVPALNKNSPAALQQLLVGGAFSFNAILQAINLDQVHAAEREDALSLLSAVLASMTPGVALSVEDTNKLMQVLDDTASLMVKELATTSTARDASTQGITWSAVFRSIINAMCVTGVSFGKAQATVGRCTKTTRTITGLQSCVNTLTDILGTQFEYAGPRATGSFVVGGLGTVPRSSLLITVLGDVTNQLLAFDPASLRLLGNAYAMCLYDQTTDQLIPSAETEVTWDMTLYDSLKRAIPEKATAGYLLGDGFDEKGCFGTVENVDVPSIKVTCKVNQTLFPTVVGPINGVPQCRPILITGCVETNGAETLEHCACRRCGNGYVPTPYLNGLLCKREGLYRCDSNEHVNEAWRCIGESSLTNNRCRCLAGKRCEGTPGVCVTEKQCGEVGNGYQCVAALLIHDELTQRCKCQAVDSNGRAQFCDSGACQPLKGCGVAAKKALACGYNSHYNATTGNCECAETDYCSSSAVCNPRAACSAHPPSADSSLCLVGLGYNATLRGVAVDSAVRVSLLVTTESTAATQPVSGEDVVTQSLQANFYKATDFTVDKGGTLAGKWTVLADPTPVFRGERATSGAGVTAFASVVIGQSAAQVSADANAFTEVLHKALGVDKVGMPTKCLSDEDSNKECIHTVSKLELVVVDQSFDGSCVCPSDQLCVDRVCTCPLCLNGGVCKTRVAEHVCDCPQGWHGADCGVRERTVPRVIEYRFPDANYAEYVALNASRQAAFVATSREIIDNRISITHAYKLYIQKGSIRVIMSFESLNSVYTNHISKAATFETALLLKARLSSFLTSPFGVPQWNVTLSENVCEATPNCVDLPVHWTTPPCMCLECATGFMPDFQNNNKTCISSEPCLASVACSSHGVAEGFAAIGCNCTCAANFESSDPDNAPFCDVDNCLKSAAAWKSPQCGVARCAQRFDDKTEAGDAIGECVQASGTSLSPGTVTIIVFSVILLISFAAAGWHFCLRRRMPWEGEHWDKELEEVDTEEAHSHTHDVPPTMTTDDPVATEVTSEGYQSDETDKAID